MAHQRRSLTSVKVALGQNSYSVHFGRLSGLQRVLKKNEFPEDRFLVTDSGVQKALAPELRQLCRGPGRWKKIVIPSGEKSKSARRWLQLTEALSKFDSHMRLPGVVAVGGGVVGDLAGFVAATYRRGVPLCMVPTTLLAMVDSSVGGKTAVDLGKIKNRVGAFHQPKAVFVDTNLVRPLSNRQYRAGLAEVVKYGALGDKKFFRKLEAQGPRLCARDNNILGSIVRACVSLKAKIVAKDERDTLGPRAVLNFGHTVGHALESALWPSLLHGEAVAIGMVVEAELALGLGWMSKADVQRLEALLLSFGLKTRKKAALKVVLRALGGDKKFTSGKMRFALAGPLGRCRLTEKVTLGQLKKVLVPRLQG